MFHLVQWFYTFHSFEEWPFHSYTLIEYLHIATHFLIYFIFSDTRKEEHVHIHVPDTITTWSIDFIALSKKHGLGVSKPALLRAFKDFFVEMTLPYSVIRGEQLRVPVTVYNYMDFCVQVWSFASGFFPTEVLQCHVLGTY